MSSKIKDGLFMGDVDAAQDAEFLQLNGITVIINCVPREVPNVFQQSLGLAYTACDLPEVLERPFFDLQNREFTGLIQLIDRALERTDSVLVHSLDGLCRSPSLMIGYLMVKYIWGLDKAHEFVAIKRSDIKLHESYVEQLTGLESQLQKNYPSKATEYQMYEWNLRETDAKSDEMVLVHTFLNSSSVTAAAEHSDTPRHISQRKQSSQRRIVWIDQSNELKKLYPSLVTRPERPPNNSYSEMRPANGWVDLLDPSPPAGGQIDARKLSSSTSNRSVVETTRQAFADVSISTNLAAIKSSDGIETSFDRPDRSSTTAPKRSMRALSFSAPKSSNFDQDASVSPVNSERDEAELLQLPGKPGTRSTSSQPRYLQDTQSSMSSRPRRSFRMAPGSAYMNYTTSSALGNASTDTYGYVGSTTSTRAPKPFNRTTTKPPLKRAVSKPSHQLPTKSPASIGNWSSSGSTSRSQRVFLDTDFPIESSTTKAPSSKVTGNMSARSARRSLSDNPLSDRNTSAIGGGASRPRTAPVRSRKDSEDHDPGYRKRSDPGASSYVGLAPTIEPLSTAYHRVHTSFDYGIAPTVNAPSVTTTAPSRSYQQRRSAPTASGSSSSRTRTTSRVSWK